MLPPIRENPTTQESKQALIPCHIDCMNGLDTKGGGYYIIQLILT